MTPSEKPLPPAPSSLPLIFFGLSCLPLLFSVVFLDKNTASIATHIIVLTPMILTIFGIGINAHFHLKKEKKERLERERTMHPKDLVSRIPVWTMFPLMSVVLIWPAILLYLDGMSLPTVVIIYSLCNLMFLSTYFQPGFTFEQAKQNLLWRHKALDTAFTKSGFPDADTFGRTFFQYFSVSLEHNRLPMPTLAVLADFCTLAEQLYRRQLVEPVFVAQMPAKGDSTYKIAWSWWPFDKDIPQPLTQLMQAYTAEIEHYERLYADPKVPDRFLELVVFMFVGMVKRLPPVLSDNGNHESSITVPIKALCPDIETIVFAGAYECLRQLVSAGIALEKSPFDVHKFFVQRISNLQVPFNIPDELRFAHHWIVAKSRHGKTQMLQLMILDDLKRVERGECSIVVIDSQNQLIPNIANLKLFAPGQPLDGKLCLLDPTDYDYPLAFNLFDTGESTDSHVRDRQITAQTELYEFIFSGLLEHGMTAKQRDVFNHLTTLIFELPKPSLTDFINLLEPKGIDKYGYRKYVERLDPIIKRFFDNEYDATGKTNYDGTKHEVAQRIHGMLGKKVFRRMFLSEKTKFNIGEELNAGKVVLVNTAENDIGADAVKLFGRLILALVVKATIERASQKNPKPTFVYIDEAWQYCKDDPNIVKLLAVARKQKVGIVLAHHFLGQLGAEVPTALGTNTAIRFAGKLEVNDLSYMARGMRCEPEFIAGMPQFSFAAYVDDLIPRAIPLTIKPGKMEHMDKMTESERWLLRAEMREKYATPLAKQPTFDEPPPREAGEQSTTWTPGA